MPKIRELKRNYIGKTVKKWLIDADMSQQQLAEKIGMTPQNLNHKIKTNTFYIHDMVEIIWALNVPDDEVLKTMRKERT